MTDILKIRKIMYFLYLDLDKRMFQGKFYDH